MTRHHGGSGGPKLSLYNDDRTLMILVRSMKRTFKNRVEADGICETKQEFLKEAIRRALKHLGRALYIPMLAMRSDSVRSSPQGQNCTKEAVLGQCGPKEAEHQSWPTLSNGLNGEHRQ